MNSRIQDRFNSLRAEGRKAFIPYIMFGDPDTGTTESLILMLEDCGADVIELGVPFTDPLADGPTIQMAAERALAQGVTLKGIIRAVASIREKTDIPIVLMTYYNPVYKYGDVRFVRDAANAGVDGVIIPDLPPDEAHEFISEARGRNLDTIFLLAPTSTEERIRLVARASRGFVYYVSMTGITGSKLKMDDSIKRLIGKIKAVSDKPVCVGFGVSTPDQAKAMAAVADGVIIGSAIVKTINTAPSKLEKFLLGLRKAI
ncbi:tryptophan synthase alpha chain [bacterium BMS3Abin07]|nr:tryptophan synthase alpha chain [bacterium BMS3Abin07]GBE31419.1 tryptophan synthase alpha chain [bacterium BMS3Bbin05]HDL21248.1 tryptophan synthase subunit alpha [Nitrospirota bacterium]HDZ87342.1 tryptophan synthase subunit alpha [Nitrospirota bacterium]